MSRPHSMGRRTHAEEEKRLDVTLNRKWQRQQDQKHVFCWTADSLRFMLCCKASFCRVLYCAVARAISQTLQIVVGCDRVQSNHVLESTGINRRI